MATYHLRVKNDTQPSGTKVSAKRHADYILREDGKSHVDYINREGAQGEKTDCVFKSSQLPKWAKGSAQKFFSAATRYEDKGNRRYKEIELSLPNELILEQNCEIVDRFIANHLSNHYYAYAIHEKAGELSGERHPHVHIMFSERLIDDVEKKDERPACKYFRRAARPLKGERIASFERRKEHGAPKAPKWHDKKYLCEMRADFALIQNEVLANFEDETLNWLNQGILFELARIQKLKRKMVGFLGARERAREEYLPASDYLFIQDYENKLRHCEDLERLSKELIPPTGKYPEDIQAFQTIMRGIEKKISDLRSFLAQSNSQYWAIQRKLEEPYRRKNVELVMHRLLQNDLDVLRDLKKTSTAVLKNVDTLRAKIEVQEMPKSIFTAREVRDNLFQQYRSLKKQREEAIDTCNRLMFKRIFPSEAISIAKNIFVHDGFKNLRSEQDEYEKALANYEHETSEILQRELVFQNKKGMNRAEKFQAQYYLTKEKIHLEETGRRLSETKIRQEKELTRLESLCQTKEAQEKIAFDEGYRSLKQNRLYRVIQPENHSTKTSNLKENKLVAIIADALLGESYAVQLVARSSGDNLEMEKDWEMMLESDKDELIRKKIVREL